MIQLFHPLNTYFYLFTLFNHLSTIRHGSAVSTCFTGHVFLFGSFDEIDQIKWSWFILCFCMFMYPNYSLLVFHRVPSVYPPNVLIIFIVDDEILEF